MHGQSTRTQEINTAIGVLFRRIDLLSQELPLGSVT